MILVLSVNRTNSFRVGWRAAVCRVSCLQAAVDVQFRQNMCFASNKSNVLETRVLPRIELPYAFPISEASVVVIAVAIYLVITCATPAFLVRSCGHGTFTLKEFLLLQPR